MTPKTLGLMRRGDKAIAESRRIHRESEAIRQLSEEQRGRRELVRLGFRSVLGEWRRRLRRRPAHAGDGLTWWVAE